MKNSSQLPEPMPATDLWGPTLAALHRAGAVWVLALTGGGSGGIGRLLEVPGGSASTLEAVVPYCAESLQAFLGRAPEQACSPDTALALAATAWRRAVQLRPVPTAPPVPSISNPPGASSPAGSAPLAGSVPAASTTSAPRWIGVGCTAALVSDRPKRGTHRCHIALHSSRGTRLLSLTLAKGIRTRVAEERVVADAWLRLLAEELSIAAPAITGGEPGDLLETRFEACDPSLRRLYEGQTEVVWRPPAGMANAPLAGDDGAGADDVGADVVGLLPGSFNPVHAGHQRLRQVAEAVLGGPVAWEMSVLNVDKPPLDALTLAQRCRTLTEAPVALTGVSLFVDKARVLPGRTFVVGADTAERIVSPRYYGDDWGALRRALSGIREHGCRFLVAGRLQGETFQELNDLSIPAEFADLFQGLTAAQFRSDLSSTQIRRERSQPHGAGD